MLKLNSTLRSRDRRWYRMRKILPCILILVLLASAVPLAITPAAAYEKKIPYDDGDNELTKDELAKAILPYMLDEGGVHTLDDVGDTAYVYAYWHGKPKTIIDSADRTVTIYRPVERIVTCNRHFLEVLQGLKVPKDKVVGVPDGIKRPGYNILYPGFQDVPIVVGGYNPSSAPDCEAIIGLHPDAVLLYAFYHGSDAATDMIESVGITVFRLSFNRPHIPNLFQEEVKKLGYIFGEQAETEELLDFYEGCQNLIKEGLDGIPEEDRPKVYSESWDQPYVTTERYARIEIAGGKNIFPGMGYEASMSVDPEVVARLNPDIIVKVAPNNVASGYELDIDDTAGLEKVREEIMSRPELQNVSAVKNGSVYVISGHIMAAGPRSGCKYFVQDAYDAKWFHQEHHQELFEDLDPQAIHQEYLTEFQGLDINLKEEGVFVYPEPS
jgi:iron complex transport system substrate-binding protein